MIQALGIAVGLFIVSGLVHLAIWRVRRPLAYPIWLPAIFLSTPVLICLASMITSAWHPGLPIIAAMFEIVMREPFVMTAALVLYLALSACYTCGYAGIVEYSPSAEILQTVAQHMPGGIAVDKLEVPSLTEQALTGKRIHHLLDSEMIHSNGNRLMLTHAGQRVVNFWKYYRKVFGIVLAS